MAAQIPETVVLDGRPYDLCGVKGENRLFNPQDHGVTPIALTSECWRGYMSTYLVADGMLYLDEIEIGLDPRDPTGHDHLLLSELFGELRLNGFSTPGHYENLGYPIALTGGLLLGRGFIDEPYVCMGFHPAFTFRHVVELALNDGQVVTGVDRSREIEEVRKKMACGDWDGMPSLPEWIESCFEIEYN